MREAEVEVDCGEMGLAVSGGATAAARALDRYARGIDAEPSTEQLPSRRPRRDVPMSQNVGLKSNGALTLARIQVRDALDRREGVSREVHHPNLDVVRVDRRPHGHSFHYRIVARAAGGRPSVPVRT